MADITSKSTDLKNLKRQASELAAAVNSLPGLFEEEATRMKRRDQVARLNALRSVVLERVERLKADERVASSANSQARMLGSIVRLGAGLVTMASENRMAQAISRQLLKGSTERELPFGTVFVRFGPKGIPDGVDVINISHLARESYRSEREVMDRLLGDGSLLFGAEAFSHIIDRLAAEILQGTLGLPLSVERLHELQGKLVLRLSSRKG